MARMTKADIIESVYEKVGGFSKKEAAEIVETVFNVSEGNARARREDQDLGLR
jgi:nucleoid DNA-binding protein